MLIISGSLLLLLLLGIFSLIYLQTSRFIWNRTLGIFLILTGVIVKQLISQQFYKVQTIIIIVLAILAFLSDYWSATIKTWYFRISSQAIWGTVIGGFIGLFFLVVGNLYITGFIIGSLFGGIVGEIIAYKHKAFKRLLKAAIGSFVGLLGMGTKLLIGLEMIEIYINLIK